MEDYIISYSIQAGHHHCSWACSQFWNEGVLELVDVLHELLVHLDLLHGYLPRVRQVVAHVVVLFVLDGPLERRDHLALALDQLHLLLHGVQVGVVDVLFGPHSLLFESLRIHHAVGAHFQVRVVILLHHVIGVLAIVTGSWVHWHWLSAHQRSGWGMKLLGHLLLVKLLMRFLPLPLLGRAASRSLLLRNVLCVAAAHSFRECG